MLSASSVGQPPFLDAQSQRANCLTDARGLSFGVADHVFLLIKSLVSLSMAVQNCSDSKHVVVSHQPGLSESFFFLDLWAVAVEIGNKAGLAAKWLESSSAKRLHSQTSSLLLLLLSSSSLMIKHLSSMQEVQGKVSSALATLMWLSCQMISCFVVCFAGLPHPTMSCKWKDSPFLNRFLVSSLCWNGSLDGCVQTCLVLLDARDEGNEALEALEGWIVKGWCWIVKGWCWLSQRIDRCWWLSRRSVGFLRGECCGFCVGDSLEELTRQTADDPEVVKGDDWPNFSLSTKTATGVDGGGCCLFHWKWLGSWSVGVRCWNASWCCCCDLTLASSGVSHSSAKSWLVSSSNSLHSQAGLCWAMILHLFAAITPSEFETVVKQSSKTILMWPLALSTKMVPPWSMLEWFVAPS